MKNNIQLLVNPDSVVMESGSRKIFERLQLSYLLEMKKESLRMPGSAGKSVNCCIDNTLRYKFGSRMTLTLDTGVLAKTLELIDFRLELQPGLDLDCKMMVNGYQSWSRSEEMGANDRIAPLSFPARPLLAPCGDSYIYRYSGKRGRFHSWTYTYFRNHSDETLFIGSLDEKSGYTHFEYDYNSDRLVISKDCTGAAAGTGYMLLNLYIGYGHPDQLFEEYMSLIEKTRAPAPKASGWCSWYNYYTNVSESIIHENLAALAKNNVAIDYFQVDDGWQKAIGDWFDCNEKFPSGMQSLATEIKTHQFRPGLWLSPMICVPSSDIYREKPEWLLRDERGKPVRAGYNPGWEGYFYALDFYAPGFQDHLRRLFDLVQNRWGYSMLKLDFLYAASLIPQHGRSRGQIMTEVVDFIDQQTRNSTILGCGVPLGPAFGKFDYCRIGSDVGPYWEDYLKYLNYPERVSTENSLVCTIGRRHLDRRAFRNDPDVYLLRDGVPGINENRLTANQRYTLFLLNNLLGGLVFFSDDVEGLTAGQLTLLRRSFPGSETVISDLDSYAGLFNLEFITEAKSYLLYANLSSSLRTVKLPGSYYYHPDHFILQPRSNFNLEPFQSICFYKVECDQKNPYLIGATGHIFPGAQIEELKLESDEATIKLHPAASPETEVYLALLPEMSGYKVNLHYYGAESKNGLKYIKVPQDHLSGQ